MKTAVRTRLRVARKNRVRMRIKKHFGNRPRLTIFRSAKHIYAQIVDDLAGQTLVSESTLSAAFKDKKLKSGGNKEAAAMVGALLGAKAAEKGITEICCDRNGFVYAGRVKALADAVREKGIKF